MQGKTLEAAEDTADVYQMISAMYREVKTHRNMLDGSCVCDDKLLLHAVPRRLPVGGPFESNDNAHNLAFLVFTAVAFELYWIER